MENNVDRYAEVIKDLLFIANARVEVKAATNRLKKNLTVHELSTNPCCERSDARYALNKVLNDVLIGELTIDGNFSPTRLSYKSLRISDGNVSDGAALIAKLIENIGLTTIIEEKLR